MPNVREILHRFRPAGTPGAPASLAAPADRRLDAEQELAPVFAALAEVQRACADVVRQAERDAEQNAERARWTARTLVARATSVASAERAAAAASARAAAGADTSAIANRARADADSVRAGARSRLPELVDRVVDRVRTALEAAS